MRALRIDALSTFDMLSKRGSGIVQQTIQATFITQLSTDLPPRPVLRSWSVFRPTLPSLAAIPAFRFPPQAVVL